MIGVVTGLAFEARDFRAGWGEGAPCARAGLGETACIAAETLVADGARALVSFGLAGGLVPDLAPGTAVMPQAVVHGAGVWRLAPANRLAGELDAVAGSVRSQGPTVFDLQRLAKVSLQTEPVRFQVGCVRHRGQQMDVQVVDAVGRHRQIMSFRQVRDL